MFRGETKLAWEARLAEHGWPQPMAGLIAAWVVGTGPLPHWPPTSDEHQMFIDKLRIVP